MSDDAIVVGGGPAGSVTAILLARAGLRVRLLTKPTAAGRRYDLLSGSAIRRLHHLFGDDLVAELRGEDVLEVLSFWRPQAPTTFNALQSPYGPGIAVQRSRLADVLLRVAKANGVQVIENAMVTAWSVDECRNAVNVQSVLNGTNCTHTSPLLFLASGIGGCGPVTEEKSNPKVCIFQTFRATNPINIMTIERTDFGWLYAMPVSSRSIGVGCVFVPHNNTHGARPMRVFRVLSEKAFSLSMPYGSIEGIGSATGSLVGPRLARAIASPCVVRVGDAAFSPDPLSGFGIEFAIISAEVAAKAALSSSPNDAFSRYSEDVRSLALDHFRTSRSLNYVDENPVIATKEQTRV